MAAHGLPIAVAQEVRAELTARLPQWQRLARAASA
jgi:hypothetical protein